MENEVTRSPSIEDEATALASIINILQNLSTDSKTRLIQTISTFFGLSLSPSQSALAPSNDYIKIESTPNFSDDRSMSPKEFLIDKQPTTDVERVVCLAYYLTHYRDTPHFKTIDISKLNTEAAQRKFSNAANSVDNANRSDYLVPSTKGQKQLGFIGEAFVDALPNHEEAKMAVKNLKPKRKRTQKKKMVSLEQ